jgi:hypothetical protein
VNGRVRTFVLDGYSEKFKPGIAMSACVEVIEKKPVLDLLECWYKEAAIECESRVDFETAELLRANGRNV